MTIHTTLSGIQSHEADLFFDFAGDRTLIPGRGGFSLEPTFTRTTASGMYFDADSVGQFAASGAAVFDHDPALNNKPLGYRQFPQYTNGYTQNVDLSHANWSRTGTPSPTENVGGAIDGVASSWTLTDNDAAASEFIFQDITTVNNEQRCVQVFVDKDSVAASTRTPDIDLTYTGGSTPLNNVVRLDTSTGAVGLRSGDVNSSDLAFGCFDRGSKWEVWICGSNNATGNTTFKTRLRPAGAKSLTGANDLTATGSATFSLPHTAALNHWTPTVKTTTAAVTVNADSPAAVADISWLRDGEGTLVIEGRSARPSGTSVVSAFATISDGSTDEAIRLGLNTGVRNSFRVRKGAVEQANMADTSNDNPQFSDFIAAGAYKLNSFLHYANGADTDAEDTSGTPPANADLTQIRIGRDGAGNNPVAGWISRVEYRSRQLVGTELDTFTLPAPTFDWNPKEDQSLVERTAGITLSMASGSATFNANGLAVDASNVLAAITDMSWNHQHACSMLVEFVPNSDPGADHVLIEISDGSAGFDNSRILLVETTSGDIEAVNEVNGTVDATATGVAITNFTTASKAFARFARNNINVAEGGASGTGDTANTIPFGATQQMTIGVDSAGARHLDGTISRVRIWGGVGLPDDTGQDLTA